MSEAVEKRELVPKLRFPGFPGEWDDVSFGTLYEFGKSYQVSRDNLNTLSGLVGVIHYGDIHTKLPSHVDFAVTNVPYLNEASDLSINPDNAVSVGDLIFADASEDLADVGKAIEVVGLAETPISAGMHTILAKRRTDRPEPGFGGFYIRSPLAQSQIRHQAQGTKVFGISGSRLAQIRVFLPSDLIEQRKIADFLESLDRLIAAETEKLDALKRQKKGLLQQLFPLEGETIPRLRFPQFRNSAHWNMRRVDELFKVTRGEVLAMPLVDEKPSADKPYPVFSSQTKRDGLAGYYSRFLYADAITWTTDGANAGEVRYRGGKFFCTNVCGVLLSKDGFANECVATLLNSVSRAHVSYVGNPKLMNNVMASIEIAIPSLSEQLAISSLLQDIDSVVRAAETRSALHRTHKAALMQQLFPSLDEVDV